MNRTRAWFRSGPKAELLPLFLLFFTIGFSLASSGCAGVTASNPGGENPLTIANVAASNISSTAARITWSTNLPATSQVEYGTTANYGASTPLDSNLATSHAQALSSLQPTTLYHYRVRSRDANNREALSPNFTFTTTAQPDTTPPTISGVNTSNITPSTATITWSTNEPADSLVEYGTSTSYGQSTPLNASLVTNHSMSLASLTPSTLYHYRVQSKDAAGNLATSSDFTFTTTAAADTTPPTVSITSPASGATVSGTVTVSASASDNVGVVGVQFLLDGANLGPEDTTAPYTVSWNTTTAANGTHTLSARARDAAGNTATAAGVSVTVSNGGGSSVIRVGPADPWCDTINAAAPSTEVILLAGSYTTPCFIRAAGTAAAPIIIRSETAASSARAVLAYPGATSNVIDVAGSFLELRWLSFASTQDAVDAIRIRGGHDLLIDQNFFEGIGGVSVVSNDVSVQRIIVWDNVFRNLKSTGMYFGCHDGAGCHATELLIEGNLIDGVMPTDAVSVGYGLEIKLNSYGAVRDNTVYRTKGPGIMVYGSDRGDPPSIVEGNYVEGSLTEGGIVIGGGPAIVRNNVAVGNAFGGISAQDYNSRGLQRNIWIVHNTLLNNEDAGINVQRWSPGNGNVLAFNAIAPLAGTSALRPASPAATVVGNVTCDSLASCFNAATTAPYDLWPAIGGPLIDAAGSGPDPWRPADDFMGVSRGSAADVGAFERNSSGSGPLVGGGNPRPRRLSSSPPDTTPPTVSITSPASGATVSGTITLAASASDNVGVAGVQFLRDGANLGAEDNTAPYSVSWNTTTVINGSHTLSARARDAAGNQNTAAQVTVTVSNVADTTPPSTPTGLTATPASSSQINLSWNVSTDNVGVAGYRIYRNGTQIATTQINVYNDTGLAASTTYSYRVAAYDAAGNQSAQSTEVSATTQAPGTNPIDNLPPGHWYEVPNSRLRSVAPPDPPGDVACVITCWSGGAYDSKRDRLIVWGGGHGQYGGNEIYVFDINNLQWERVNDPSPVDQSPCAETYSDGKPRSVHTYDYLVYAPNVDRFLSMGISAAYPGICGFHTVWSFDFASKQWERRATLPGNMENYIADYDPMTGHVWVHTEYSDGILIEYDPVTNNWWQRNSFEDLYMDLPYTGRIDPIRRKMVSIGGGDLYVWNIAAPGNDIRAQRLSTTGDTSIISVAYPGFEYDSAIDKFVAWSGGANVYLLDMDTLVWKMIPPAPTNTVIPTSATPNGTTGRFRYIPSKNAFVVVNSVDENVYVYKLPSNAGKP